MASVVQLNESIAALVEEGASLDEVESDVIDPSGLESDRKDALWLYAWSVMELREQRDQATHYVLNVGPG